MNDPMLEPSHSSDTLSGIRIEESLNSQFNSLEARVVSRGVGETSSQTVFESLILQWSPGAGGWHSGEWELRSGVRPDLQPGLLLQLRRHHPPQSKGQRHGRHGGHTTHHHIRQAEECHGESTWWWWYLLFAHINNAVWSIILIFNKTRTKVTNFNF